MPVFKNRTSLETWKNIKAFLNFEAGLTRGEIPSAPNSPEIRRLRRNLEAKEEENELLRSRLKDENAGEEPLQSKEAVDPGNLVWIFGSGRSGSTWLARMMSEIEDQTLWNEPLVGTLFGSLYYVRAGDRIGKPGKHFILGGGYRESWLKPMRDLVLSGAGARFPQAVRGGYLIVKEPNGSVGAPLLMETLPESRMILLIRDPRDVVSSTLDAYKEGNWLDEQARASGKRQGLSRAQRNPDVYVKKRSEIYLESVGKAKQAYESHEGDKTIVRYEDLRSDTLAEMRRIYSDLNIPVDETELRQAVEKHSWNNIPEEDKGPGKLRRKAKPGGWEEDLTPEQVESIEKITAPILDEFYRD